MPDSILSNNDTFQKVIEVYKTAQKRNDNVYSEILGLKIVNLAGVFCPLTSLQMQ